MQYLSFALPLAALASGALANPLEARGKSDACLAAVTGNGALGDPTLRASHCASFLATTVTPPAVTVTATVTGSEPGEGLWKRASVTVCPNQVPNYASACDDAAYSSACSRFGYTDVKTTTLEPSTTTKTVYILPTWGSCPPPSTVTSTVTKGYGGKGAVTTTVTDSITVYVSGNTTTIPSVVTTTVTLPGANATTTTTVTLPGTNATTTTTVTLPGTNATTTTTVTLPGTNATTTATVTLPGTNATTTTTTTVTATVTANSTSSSNSTSCVVTDALATSLVNDFINFLTNTGANFDTALANQVLDPGFTDTSDSINWMTTTSSFPIPLGSVTFASAQDFIYGQGAQPAVASVETLNIWHDCSSITWRWRLTPYPGAPFPVVGINYMEVSSSGQLLANFAEFDNAAWVSDINPNATCYPPASSSKKRSVDARLLKSHNHQH